MAIFDLPSIQRHAIGFERIFNELNRMAESGQTSGNYPPYNIVKTGENTYAIELAVAGFTETDLDVEYVDNVLVVTGQKARDTETEPEYIYRGIGLRNFTRKFTLADNMEVRGATVTNGIMSIQLEHIVPEEARPKKIAITFTQR